MKTLRCLPWYVILALVVFTTGCGGTRSAWQVTPNTNIAAMSDRYLDKNEKLIGSDQPVGEIICPWQLQIQRQITFRVAPESDMNLPVH